MNIAVEYINKVRSNCSNATSNEWDLDFWRNKLFFTTIVYVLPLSLIALIPGLYWILKIEHYALALVDISAVICIVVVAFLPRLRLVSRKIIFISSGYLFSCAILYYVGLNGPGLIYLLTASIFSILIFSTSYVYWSAWVNTFICFLYALLIQLELLPNHNNQAHNIEEWVAVSTNLIFLSFLCAALIPRLFKGLQKTIDNEVQLKKILEAERSALDETSKALQYALNDVRKTMDSSLDVICAIDADGRFIRVSAACEEVWGYKAEDLVGKFTLDFVYAEDYLKTKEVSDKVLAGINAVNFENRYIHKNGSLIPISWTASWDEKDQIRYSVARDITDRKNLEKDVEIEKKRFHDLFLESPMSMGVVSGPDHVYEVVNPLYLELIGKTEIIGKSVKEVLPSVVGQGIITMLDNVYSTGETFHVSEMFLKSDYDENTSGKFLNFSCQAHYNSKNEVDGIFFFAIDVSEQVLSRKKVETSQARLTEAQAIAKLGNWEVDLITNSHYWSDEVYQIFGVSKDDVLPGEAAFMAFVHPDDVTHAYTQINHGFSTNENITFDFRFIRKDGSLRHGYNEWKFKFDENGKPEILSGILQDVTDWRNAEQQLKNSEEFSRGVLDSLTSNICVIDFSGVLVAINESWKNYGIENGTNTLQGTGIGSNYFEVCKTAIVAGVDYAEHACEGIKNVMNNQQEVFYFEYPCHTSEQKEWFGMRVMKFEGNQELIVISHHDITKRKQAEFERAKVAKDLIQRNKDLEQFTYMVSHNLRAPVANILGLVGVLGSEGLITEEKEKLNEGLFDSVNKLDDVVKDLNLILQVRGEMQEKNETVNFSKLVEDIKISIKNLIDMDVIDIQHDFSEVNEFLTLKTYLHSIFYNLITNSIKYRQQKIPCFIAIKSHLIDDQVVLTFTDNSLGIDLSKRGDQIFGLYKRFHSHVEGKGLGLFMVKTQVEKLGGKISVQSEVNKGTEFKIEFGD